MGSSALDTAFVGGSVFDGADRAPVRTDVGVVNGTIAAIGIDDVWALRGPTTRVIDMTDRLLTPGFIDAHIHPTEGGVERLACDLSGGSTRADYLHIVHRYCVSHPAERWITGGGWQQAIFAGSPPSRTELDRVCPDRPVVLANRDHHGVWVNSRALDAAHIDAGTPDPRDGVIERDAAGEPTGILQEGAAELVLRLLPAPTLATLYAGFMEAQRYLHSVGVTGWQDALIGDYGNHRTLELAVYERALARGELRARVNAALWWDRDRTQDQLADLIAIRDSHQSERFRVTTIKIMQDGIPENGTAALLDPYLPAGSRRATGARGLSFFDPQRLSNDVAHIDAAGFQIHFHAIGDRAVRECLDAVQHARRVNAHSSTTHHIAHVQLVDPSDIPRFRHLNVAANIQPLWAAYDRQMVELDLPLLGADRAQTQYPFASFHRHGTLVCAGSDWPVTSADPWQAIHIAVNRRHPAGSPDWYPHELVPGERLSLGQALAAYTSGSARINGRERLTGTIRVGRAADLAIADRNPFQLPKEDIATTRTDETFVDGVSVYRRSTDAAIREPAHS